MSASFGIICAFIALISWGVGDFLIQRTTRIAGSLQALFFIGAAGAVALLPFVAGTFKDLTSGDIILLLALGGIILIAALSDFEALRLGKMAVVEPIIALELPLTVALGVAIGRDPLSSLQTALIAAIFLGILLMVSPSASSFRKISLEKGVLLACVGAVAMALTNYFTSVAAREVSPLMAIWFTHTSLAVVCGAYLLISGKFRAAWTSLRQNPKTIIGQSVFDNAGWISFAAASAIIPVSLATTISEAYIALAVLLGIIVNRERLKVHRYFGVAGAILGVVVLAMVSS